MLIQSELLIASSLSAAVLVQGSLSRDSSGSQALAISDCNAAVLVRRAAPTRVQGADCARARALTSISRLTAIWLAREGTPEEHACDHNEIR